MRLLSIRMEHFRSFYGVNDLEFSASDSRPVTVIHGENGIGKTTILNAVFWCFYGKTTASFSNPRELINRLAISEGREWAAVDVRLLHEGMEYVARRGLSKASSEEKFTVHAVDSDGNSKSLQKPWAFINSVMPETMAPYFFFHGEGLTKRSSGGVGSSFRQAIRNILGFSFAETAAEDLKHIAKRDWGPRVKELSAGQAQLKKALAEKQAYQTRIDEASEKVTQLDEEISNLATAIDALGSELASSNHADASKLQQELRSKEALRDSKAQELRDLGKQRQLLVKRYGWAIFGTPLAEAGLDFIDEAQLKGRIPAPYDRSLVNDILDAASCICGRAVEPGTDEESAIKALLETANTASIQQRLQKARGVSDKIYGLAEEFLVEAGNLESGIAGCNSDLARVTDEINRIEQQITEISDTDIAEKRSRFRDLRNERDTKVGRRNSERDAIVRAREALRAAERIVLKEAKGDRQLQRAQTAEMLISALADRCETRLAQYEVDSIDRIRDRVNSILEQFSRKSYRVAISEEYDASLILADGSRVGESTGERLLLNLAFVSALIDLARERLRDPGDFLVHGTVGPFMIDAPFSELDRSYQSATAEFLPKHSEQLILLLSSSHWTEAIDEKIRPLVGKEYVLVSHSDKLKEASKPEDVIVIAGRTYEQSRYGEARPRTSVMEVR